MALDVAAETVELPPAPPATETPVLQTREEKFAVAVQGFREEFRFHEADAQQTPIQGRWDDAIKHIAGPILNKLDMLEQRVTGDIRTDLEALARFSREVHQFVRALAMTEGIGAKAAGLQHVLDGYISAMYGAIAGKEFGQEQEEVAFTCGWPTGRGGR